MGELVEISSLNPVRWYLDGSANSLEDLANPYEQSVKQYCQKFTKSMFLNFQIRVLTGEWDSFSSDVEQLNADGTITTVLGNIAFADNITGSTYEYDIITARGHILEGKDICKQLPVGVYRLNFNFVWLDTEISDMRFLTEWFEIIDPTTSDELKELRDNFMLVRYGHNENDYGAVFQMNIDGSDPQYFEYMIEGGMWSGDFTPVAKDTAYTDQLHDVVLLKSIPYNTFKLTFGTAKGFPNWIANLLNFTFSCDTILINNRQYCKAEGAKLEATNIDRYPYRSWALEVQYPETVYSDTYGGSLALGDFNYDFDKTDFL